MADALGKRPFRADSASMKRVGLPFLAVAAFTLLVIQHLVRRKTARRRLGRGSENKTDDVQDEDKGSSHSDDGCLDDPSQPMTVEELRSRRIRAMEARLSREASDPGAARLTPLGCMLRLSSQIDGLEEEVMTIVLRRKLGSQAHEDYGSLLESLRKARKEIDNIQNDESIREYKKVQIVRLDSLITELQRRP